MEKINMNDPDSPLTLYIEHLESVINLAINNQREKIEQSGGIIADCLVNGGLLHVFGTGHSHMLAEEMFARAGGLMPVNAILIPRLMLHENTRLATELERDENLAQEVIADQPLKPGDVIIIVSNSGRNGLAIEVARLAKEIGLTVIALTALEYSKNLKSRHSTGLLLYQVSDLTLDNYGQSGDVSVGIPGTGIRTGATSTILGSVLLNAVVIQTILILQKMGITPPVFSSSNLASADEQNSLDILDRAGKRLAPFTR
jgi:uncharacterized phosphosugar-binding protein